jgi:hypothetical protein
MGFDDDELPQGFEPLSAKKVDGWFKLTPGNKVQGFLLAKVKKPSKFKAGETEMFVKIELTNGTTEVDDGGKVVTLKKGQVCGLDIKGYLAALRDMEDGREVWVYYQGKETKAPKAGMSPAHVFKVAAVPV